VQLAYCLPGNSICSHLTTSAGYSMQNRRCTVNVLPQLTKELMHAVGSGVCHPITAMNAYVCQLD
jgi:hypothetical protein